MARSALPAFARFCSALELEQGGAMELESFQRRILSDYFAGVRETLVLLPKKNGKTTLVAALALFHLIVTPDAECVIGAASRDQATILFDQAAGFVRRSRGLTERLSVKGGYRQIRNARDAGRIRVLAADVDTADGVIPTLALVDELHRHRSSELYGVFRDALGPRDGQMITISTAGDHELTPLGLMRASARKLPIVKRTSAYLHARSDEGSYALHEWALPPDADVDEIRTVKRANPASWQTIELLAERKNSPSMLPWQWARFACGIWTSADSYWLDPEAWNGRATDERIEDGDRIAIGFDGSRSGDATALVACRISDGLVQPLHVWEDPQDGRAWEVPAGEVDAAIARTMERFDVVRGYFDPPLWQSEIDAWAHDFGEPLVVRYPTKRARMMDAVERFRTDLIGGKFSHSGDATLTRHALNAQTRDVRGGYWLTKSRPGSPDKIDAAVAAVLAYEARADELTAAAEAAPRSRRLVTF